MKLIPEWRTAWRFNSVQAATALAILSFLQAQVLPHYEAAVPPHLWPWITGTFAMVIALLRLRAQPETEATQAAPKEAP